MAKTAWPTTTELTNRLTGLGVASTPTGVTLQDEIDAAVGVLERITGQKPFLVESAAADYLYDPTRRTNLALGTRWVSIDSVSISGDAQTENDDYYLKPYGGPYTRIEFLMPLVSDGYPLSVTVNGKRGYAATIPVEIWNAVLDYAAGRVYKTAAMAGTVALGAVTEIRQDTVDIKYAGGSAAMGQDTGSRLMDNATKIMSGYARASVGGL